MGHSELASGESSAGKYGNRLSLNLNASYQSEVGTPVRTLWRSFGIRNRRALLPSLYLGNGSDNQQVAYLTSLVP